MDEVHYHSKLTKALAEAEFTLRMPRTQEECCEVAARISLTVYGMPQDDQFLMHRASGMAAGLFEDAFEAADEFQRLHWIDMCERALRKMMKEFA